MVRTRDLEIFGRTLQSLALPLSYKSITPGSPSFSGKFFAKSKYEVPKRSWWCPLSWRLCNSWRVFNDGWINLVKACTETCIYIVASDLLVDMQPKYYWRGRLRHQGFHQRCWSWCPSFGRNYQLTLKKEGTPPGQLSLTNCPIHSVPSTVLPFWFSHEYYYFFADHTPFFLLRAIASRAFSSRQPVKVALLRLHLSVSFWNPQAPAFSWNVLCIYCIRAWLQL